MTGKSIRVLIVDDSPLMRRLLTRILEQDARLSVVGTANDAFDARDKIKALNPDVITLDVAMPGMDGVTFLKSLMKLRPMPVVMVSTATTRGADITIQALIAGAVDFVTKPQLREIEGLEQMSEELCEKVRLAAEAETSIRLRAVRPEPPKFEGPTNFASERLIAIGASTGGTDAIEHVLKQFPSDAPATVVVQHIPELFSRSFACRLDEECSISVSEARDGDRILVGHAYIAPGDQHLELVRKGDGYYCRVTRKPPINQHRPSVDVLFRSVARESGANAIGIILTGMGSDGAQGLLDIRDRGGVTIAQDETTSIVWSMPGAAIALQAVTQVLPIEIIAQRALEFARIPVSSGTFLTSSQKLPEATNADSRSRR